LEFKEYEMSAQQEMPAPQGGPECIEPGTINMTHAAEAQRRVANQLKAMLNRVARAEVETDAGGKQPSQAAKGPQPEFVGVVRALSHDTNELLNTNTAG
jgi:hypothetical protein